jgi:hypothetical protein
MVLAKVHARHQRDELLTIAVNTLNRHRNQVDFGITPTLTDQEIIEVATYAECLRKVPQQDGFPYQVVWPQTPLCMRKDVIG